MKSVQSLLPVFGLIAAAQASYGDGWNTTSTSEPVVWTTVTTDVYTTYCPESTTFTQGTKTYTATASETLTITDCPCTISHPVKPTYTPKPTKSYEAPPPPSYNATIVPPVWITTTETVKTYTTYCPAPTYVTQGNRTYTVTEATTLTITDCPCTQTKTYPGTTTTITIGTTTTYCPVPTTITTGGSTYPVTAPGTVTIPICTTTVVPVSSYTPAPPATTPEAPATTPVVPTTPVAPYPTQSTGIVTSGYASGTGVGPSPSSSPTHIQANGAAAQQFGFGAMIAGLVAMLL